MSSSIWWHQADILQVWMTSVDPEDTVQRPPQPSLSAWSTSSCGPNGSAPDKLNLISKSFPLIPPEWTVNGTSIIYTDLSVRSCAWCSGAALQQLQELRQRLGACLRHQNWGERTSFDRDGPREQERGGSNWVNLRHMKNKQGYQKWRGISLTSPVFDESLLRCLLPQYKQIQLPRPRTTYHPADLGV